jgi:hypothetical protein
VIRKVRLEAVCREMMFAEEELAEDSVEAVLRAIDALALPEDPRDRVRPHTIIDEIQQVMSRST